MNESGPDLLSQESMDVAASISRNIRQIRGTIAVAESLTSGSLSCHLGAAEASSEWFLGGVIGYSSEVKFSVFGVDRGTDQPTHRNDVDECHSPNRWTER